MAVEGEGQRQLGLDALGELDGAVRVLDVLQQDRELVAAEAGHGVAPAAGSRSRRRAMATSSWSPTWWPRLSLTILKRSRSRKSTANSGSVRRARAPTARPSRSRNSARLGSPVRSS